jgi:hypothetical protein
MYIYRYAHACVYVHVCVGLYIHMYVGLLCKYVCIHVYDLVCSHDYLCVHSCQCIRIFKYVSMNVLYEYIQYTLTHGISCSLLTFRRDTSISCPNLTSVRQGSSLASRTVGFMGNLS